MQNITPKVLVISMEKAGSTTVMHAIRSAGFEVGRVHRHNMNDINPDDYSHFVVMVRELIAKSISNYFETRKGISLKEEIEFALNFFEECVYPVCGVNVMDYGYFDRKSGWATYENKLLVIRVKDFNKQLKHALEWFLREFITTQEFEIIHHPKGYERFGTEYTRFMSEAQFSQSFLNEVYESAYCRKFGYQDMGEWQREA